MSVTKSNQNNLTSPNGNSLAVFVDINDNALKLKDINGGVEPITNYTGSSSVGLLQLQGGVALSSTLTSVTDQNGTASTLKLSTTSAQFVSPLRISTDDASEMYLDCEDGSENNRFNITRNGASQQVNLNFASNPVGSTTTVGAIRTFVNGTNLSEVMTFREDGNVGVGTTTPQGKLDVRTTDGLASAQLYSNNDSSLPLRLFRANNGVVSINTLSSGGTIDSPSDRATLGSITRFTGNAYVNGAYRGLARMEYYLDAIPTAGVAPCSIRFLTVGASSSTYSLDERMGITSDGNVQINESIVTNRNAKLFIKGSGSTSATTSLLVRNSSGTDLLKIADDGNVGIGTTTPIGILHLYKSAAATRLAIDGDAGQNRLISYRTGGLQRFGLYVNNTAESGSNAGSDFAVRAYSDAGTLLSTPLFIKRSTGNIGIGTTTPTLPFEVTQSVSGNVFAKLQNTNAAGFGILLYGGSGASTYTMQFADYNGSGGGRIYPDGIFIGAQSAPTARLQIQGSGSTSATTSLLVQNSLGNESFRVYDDRIVSIPYRVETPFIRNSSGNLVLFAGNFEVEIQSSNPTSGSGSLRTTGDITTTDNQTKSIINVNNLVSSTPAAFNTLNGFAFTSTITQTTGIIRGLFINPTLNASTDFRAIQTTSGGAYINTATPNAAACLQADSTTQGFLPPRMTTAQKVTLAATATAGLMIYDTNLNKLCVYTGAGWETITSV